jgi:hypothetical protein
MHWASVCKDNDAIKRAVVRNGSLFELLFIHMFSKSDIMKFSRTCLNRFRGKYALFIVIASRAHDVVSIWVVIHKRIVINLLF